MLLNRKSDHARGDGYTYPALLSHRLGSGIAFLAQLVDVFVFDRLLLALVARASGLHDCRICSDTALFFTIAFASVVFSEAATILLGLGTCGTASHIWI